MLIPLEINDKNTVERQDLEISGMPSRQTCLPANNIDEELPLLAFSIDDWRLSISSGSNNISFGYNLQHIPGLSLPHLPALCSAVDLHIHTSSISYEWSLWL